jgi:hypothetical protein
MKKRKSGKRKNKDARVVAVSPLSLRFNSISRAQSLWATLRLRLKTPPSIINLELAMRKLRQKTQFNQTAAPFLFFLPSIASIHACGAAGV